MDGFLRSRALCSIIQNICLWTISYIAMLHRIVKRVDVIISSSLWLSIHVNKIVDWTSLTAGGEGRSDECTPTTKPTSWKVLNLGYGGTELLLFDLNPGTAVGGSLSVRTNDVGECDNRVCPGTPLGLPLKPWRGLQSLLNQTTLRIWTRVGRRDNFFD